MVYGVEFTPQLKNDSMKGCADQNFYNADSSNVPCNKALLLTIQNSKQSIFDGSPSNKPWHIEVTQ